MGKTVQKTQEVKKHSLKNEKGAALKKKQVAVDVWPSTSIARTRDVRLTMLTAKMLKQLLTLLVRSFARPYPNRHKDLEILKNMAKTRNEIVKLRNSKNQ